MLPIEILIKTMLDMLDSGGLMQLRKIMMVDGGIELLTKIASTAADPSNVTVDMIKKEKNKLKNSSKYGWKY